MNMPSESWEEFVGEMKLAVSRGERKTIHPEYLLY